MSDALAALKSVVLMQERLQTVQRDLADVTQRVDGLADYAVSLDKRIVRLETLVEVASSRGRPPRIQD